MTISQNSIGNAITELLGVVVKRAPDAEGYEAAEPKLLERLLEVRRRLVEADLGDTGAPDVPEDTRVDAGALDAFVRGVDHGEGS